MPGPHRSSWRRLRANSVRMEGRRRLQRVRHRPQLPHGLLLLRRPRRDLLRRRHHHRHRFRGRLPRRRRLRPHTRHHLRTRHHRRHHHPRRPPRPRLRRLPLQPSRRRHRPHPRRLRRLRPHVRHRPFRRRLLRQRRRQRARPRASVSSARRQQAALLRLALRRTAVHRPRHRQQLRLPPRLHLRPRLPPRLRQRQRRPVSLPAGHRPVPVQDQPSTAHQAPHQSRARRRPAEPRRASCPARRIQPCHLDAYRTRRRRLLPRSSARPPSPRRCRASRRPQRR